MAERPHLQAGVCTSPPRRADAVTLHAAAAIWRRLAQDDHLSPEQLAHAVAAALPPRFARWLIERLTAQGWLRPEARIGFDILDGPDCPPEFRGPVREIVRLAVFGPTGQGIAWRDKHRMDVYQQLCAEIMREAVDTHSLQAAATRALNHPDVHTDPLLVSMLRGFISEREAALRAPRSTPAEEHQQYESTSKVTRGFLSRDLSDLPTRDEVLASFSRLQREFDGYLAQFEEHRAQRALARMRDLRLRFPVHIPGADLQRAEEQYDKLLRRAGTYRRQIEELAQRGAEAALTGDGKTAAWIIRRLEAVHALLPMLLPYSRLEILRTNIQRSGQVHETEEAARELRLRKRDIVVKIKDMAGVIHRFHELAARLPPDHNAYRRAELNYRAALDQLRGMNTEWLTSLVLELETLLADLDDPSGQMHTQLDLFIANVRTALNRLCLEVRAHQRSQKPRPGHAPPSGLPKPPKDPPL